MQEIWNKMSLCEQMATIGEMAEDVINSLKEGRKDISITEYGSIGEGGCKHIVMN